MSLNAAEQLFADMEEYIRSCRILLEEHREEELPLLDALAARIQEAAKSLPAQEHVAHAPRLEALIIELDVLTQELTARRGDVAGELKNVSNARKAGAAYRTAYGAPSADNDDERQ